jgi:hypothetical protein
MRKALLWLGVALCVVGVGVAVASAVLNNPSYNLGDPTKFQFILVPFWQIGLGIAVVGAVILVVSRLVRARAPAARGS